MTTPELDVSLRRGEALLHEDLITPLHHHDESHNRLLATVDGTTYPMAAPFFVLATQNPIEQEGTYRLPEAQLDRFLLKINVPYPDLEQEQQVLAYYGIPETVGRGAELKDRPAGSNTANPLTT